MSEVVKLRTRAEIEEEAATWIWRLESAASGGADREGFEAWLRQDPRHRRAVDELSKVWKSLDGLADGRLNEPRPDLTEAPAANAPRSRRHVWIGAAAATLVATVAGVLWWTQGRETQVLATAVGQHRTVTLADASVVTLNTNSIVETNIGRHSRDIYLRKGEAHFEVAQDRLRPFLVHAGDAIVRAVGTEFEVRVRPDRHVDVLVNQGRVEVQPEILSVPTADNALRNQPVTLAKVKAVSAGEELSTATNNYAVTPVSAEQLSSDLAWREGAVVFDSEPLSGAIAEIQRYTDARIAISDPSIANLPVGGRFKTDDLQGFLDGLATALPIAIRRATDGSIYIDPRP
jgi:transmembrane sensor